jgi:hypothetical protein
MPVATRGPCGPWPPAVLAHGGLHPAGGYVSVSRMPHAIAPRRPNLVVEISRMAPGMGRLLVDLRRSGIARAPSNSGHGCVTDSARVPLAARRRHAKGRRIATTPERGSGGAMPAGSVHRFEDIPGACVRCRRSRPAGRSGRMARSCLQYVGARPPNEGARRHAPAFRPFPRRTGARTGAGLSVPRQPIARPTSVRRDVRGHRPGHRGCVPAEAPDRAMWRIATARRCGGDTRRDPARSLWKSRSRNPLQSSRARG